MESTVSETDILGDSSVDFRNARGLVGQLIDRFTPHWWPVAGAIYIEWQLFKRTDTAQRILLRLR